MPQIYVTKTLGRNIVEGTMRSLSATTIRRISDEHGTEWYRVVDHRARRRFLRGELTAQDVPGKRARKAGGV